MTTRLTLLVHGATAAQRAGRVMTMRDPLEPGTLRLLPSVVSRLGRMDRVLSSPSLAALQTAEALGPPVTTDTGLRDLDLGDWTGRALPDIAGRDPGGLSRWIDDDAACPHGGETVGSLLCRTAEWMQIVGGLHGRTVAVTHATVARAAIACALGGAGGIFRHVELDPLSLVRLDQRGTGWCLRQIASPDKKAGSG